MTDKKVRIRGVALYNAKRGTATEVEVDLGYNGDFLESLPLEPPEVTLIRVQREQELNAKVNVANLNYQREKERNKLLQQELTRVAGEIEGAKFLDELAKKIADEVFERIIRTMSSAIGRDIEDY
jgi:hypothetical protein